VCKAAEQEISDSNSPT